MLGKMMDGERWLIVRRVDVVSEDSQKASLHACGKARVAEFKEAMLTTASAESIAMCA